MSEIPLNITVESNNQIYDAIENMDSVDSIFMSMDWSLPEVDLEDVELSPRTLFSNNETTLAIQNQRKIFETPELSQMVAGGEFGLEEDTIIYLADGSQVSWIEYLSNVYPASNGRNAWLNATRASLAGDEGAISEIFTKLDQLFQHGFSIAKDYSEVPESIFEVAVTDNIFSHLFLNTLTALWSLPEELQLHLYTNAESYFGSALSNGLLRLDEWIENNPADNHWLQRGMFWTAAGSYFANEEWFKKGLTTFVYAIDLARPDGALGRDPLRGEAALAVTGKGIDAMATTLVIAMQNGINLWDYKNKAGVGFEDVVARYYKSAVIDSVAMEYAQINLGGYFFDPNGQGEFDFMDNFFAGHILAKYKPDNPLLNFVSLANIGHDNRSGDDGKILADKWYLDIEYEGFTRDEINGTVPFGSLIPAYLLKREYSEEPTSGNDICIFGSGDDHIVISSGMDYLDGGDGTDVFRASSLRDSYELILDRKITYNVVNRNGVETEFSKSNGVSYLIDMSGHYGVNLFNNFERIEFSDANIAIDIDGSAGLTVKTLAAVIGEAGLFNKEYVGIGLELFDAGQSLADVCELALGAVGSITNEQVVNLLYTNLYGEAPTTEQAQPFVDLLDDGTFTKGSLAAAAAELTDDLGVIDLVGLAETGIEYV